MPRKARARLTRGEARPFIVRRPRIINLIEPMPPPPVAHPPKHRPTATTPIAKATDAPRVPRVRFVHLHATSRRAPSQQISSPPTGSLPHCSQPRKVAALATPTTPASSRVAPQPSPAKQALLPCHGSSSCSRVQSGRSPPDQFGRRAGPIRKEAHRCLALDGGAHHLRAPLPVPLLVVPQHLGRVDVGRRVCVWRREHRDDRD